MPLYDYKCLVCEHEFEDWAKISEGNPGCPNKADGKICDGETKKIQKATGGFVLRGDGWAKHGYSKPGVR